MANIYLIPIPIADDALHTLSAEVGEVTLKTTHYFVENIRTSRRFLKKLHPAIIIDELSFSEIDKHDGPDTNTFKKWLKEGHSIGIMSEAGCPGIADPGSVLVDIAHKEEANVIPLTGPSSITLALMSSGLNGQSFAFHGYLPLKEPHRSKRIKQLDTDSRKGNQTQIFIETPYRNKTVIDELLRNCSGQTKLCIAQNITAEDAFIRTKTINEWKKNKPKLAKQPAVFLLLA